MQEYLPLRHPRVEPTRGAGLWALAAIAGGWVMMRTLFIIGDDGDVKLRPFPKSVTAGTLTAEVAPTGAVPSAMAHHASMGAVPLLFQPNLFQTSAPRSDAMATARRATPLTISNDGAAPLVDWGSIDRDYMGQLGPLFLAGGTSEWPADYEVDTAGSAPLWLAPRTQNAPATGRFSLYAYLFYRPDAAAGATATMYGGSQMFVRADWRLGNKGFARRSTLYARVSRDRARGGQTEFAIGGAVQPFAAVPVTLHGERRVRTDGPDATAAFVSGGVSDVALPHGVVFNAYGQGGQVWPDRGQSSQFFDGQASLTKPVHSAGSWQLDAGGMAATGGQDSTARLDIGPVVTISAGKGGAQLRGQVGWRFRIAGDAAPANGPAVTLSVGF